LLLLATMQPLFCTAGSKDTTWLFVSNSVSDTVVGLAHCGSVHGVFLASGVCYPQWHQGSAARMQQGKAACE
jgi:hypothetical protein